MNSSEENALFDFFFFFFITLMFFQRQEWRRAIMFASFRRGVVTHLSSPTLAATLRASTQQSLKTFMESLNALLSSTCKNPELPSLLTCKRIHMENISMSHCVILKALKGEEMKPSCQYKSQRSHFCFQGQSKMLQEEGNSSKGVKAGDKSKISPSIFQRTFSDS